MPFPPDWILYFGSPACLDGEAAPVRELAERFPAAVCCGCTTAGEILQKRVHDDSVVAALVRFEGTRVRALAQPVASPADSRAAGLAAARQLQADDLRHVLVLSEGLKVNGTALVAGLREGLPENVAVTGGLAGDGARFQRTRVGLGAMLQPDQVVVVGFYGLTAAVSFGSAGGWEAFGPRRRITRSAGNVLYELDGQPALGLYKRYLGERAAGLPATGLLFPLELTTGPATSDGLVRTMLAVCEADQSLTFAGDMPENWYVRLMRAGPEQLVAGAASAGGQALPQMLDGGRALAVLVSCVGRRLVLGQRTEEEVEAVGRSLLPGTDMIGFYSYGETCPARGSRRSELHNQTMTVTVITENKLS